MAEIDYQMALLLQHRFEQEHKKKTTSQISDAEYARKLQNQLNTTPNKPQPPSSTRSLTDPSWELVDPTPDIHTLFLAFNEKFFWNKLLAVCVSWSKRMTSCAGICSYNGYGGMCSITLSEPLLKLRPRKDLIETLLHEMIHAYLFVTHNNKDRDGHGPEFHKHMYRINQESGTNITVYHSFHDEVRLYKQHWWRCDGPCQSRKPFFGMVRRAMNRAPGPHDRWWAEHQRSCGGNFIKVKEPEKRGKTKKSTPKEPQKSDIRTYLSIQDLTNKEASTLKTPTVNSINTTSNIVGFKDLAKSSVKGRSNSNSTIVITKTDNSKSTVVNPTSDNRKPPDLSSTTDDFLNVRNHWQNKFKRTAPVEVSEVGLTKKTRDEMARCPVCDISVRMCDLNAHLDLCLSKDVLKECPVCSVKVSELDFDVHVEKCLLKMCDDVEMVECLACGKRIVKRDLNSHLEECMSDFRNDFDGIEEVKDRKEYNCPFCLELIAEDLMKEHIDGCLSNTDQDILDCLTGDQF